MVDALPEASTLHLAVDDLEQLTSRDQVRLLRTLADRSGPARVSLAARRPLGAAATAALPNPLAERGPGDLALAPDVLARVLRDEHGVADPDLAYLVHDLTAGWPALVHLAGDALGRLGAGRHDLLAALTEPGTAGAAWVREQALAGLPPYAARLLDRAAQLDPITFSLCAVLAPDDAQRMRGAVSWLARTGILVPHRRQARGRAETALRLVPVLAAVLARQRRSAGRPASAKAAGDRLRAAATWYAANGHPLASALVAAERADDVIQQARILVNQADCRLREARYPQAQEVAARAVRTAELGAPPGLLVTALHNAGEALTRLGRYDEATLHFERSIRIGHRVGLKRIAAGL